MSCFGPSLKPYYFFFSFSLNFIVTVLIFYLYAYFILLQVSGLWFGRFLALCFVAVSLWMLFTFTLSKSKLEWNAFIESTIDWIIEDEISSLSYFWAAIVSTTIFVGYFGYRAIQGAAPNAGNIIGPSNDQWRHAIGIILFRDGIYIDYAIYWKVKYKSSSYTYNEVINYLILYTKANNLLLNKW